MSKSPRHSKKHAEHEEHEEHVNHEAWVIPYADMLTLLMALFLVMFAIGRVDADKFEALAQSLRTNFGGTADAVVPINEHNGGPSPVEGGTGVLDGNAPAVLPATTTPSPTAEQAPAAAPTTTPPRTVQLAPTEADVALATQQKAFTVAAAAYDELAVLKRLVRTEANARGLGRALGFRFEGRGLVVSVVTDQVLFADGRADIQPEGAHVLGVVAEALVPTANTLAIEGHTDSRPISTDRFPSNWELSTARATSVLRYLVEQHGFDPARLSAAGYAETRPVASNDTPAGAARNRRVEIVVLSSTSLDPVLDESSGGRIAEFEPALDESGGPIAEFDPVPLPPTGATTG